MTTQIKMVVQRSMVGEQAMAVLADVGGSDLSSARALILDMSHVTQLDASGIAVLVRIYSQLHTRGISLQIVNASVDLAAEFKRVAFSAIVPVTVRAVDQSMAVTRAVHA